MLAETLDAKNDKVWSECLSQANIVKVESTSSVGEKRQASDAVEGPSTQYRRYQRGGYQPF
jgi:hypothetical protein